MRRLNHSLVVVCGLVAGLVPEAIGAPDLVCSDIVGASSFGAVDGVAAYSFGTTVCNHGDSAAEWDGASDAHPLISQSIYKLKDHRIAQIGIGFVRHTTVPLSSNACGLGCTPAGFSALGAGCSDTSASSVNGAQGLMGPRLEVNALTGDYPYPFTSINQTGDAVYKRLQVSVSDVSDPDALYFVETQIVGIDDSGFNAVLNNCAYRQVTFTPGSATASLVGPTYNGPAIYAWKDHGNGIGVPDEGVMINWISLPETLEYVFVASRATQLGMDHWRYEYGVYNMNGERSIGGFSVNLCDGKSQLVETQFSSPAYHDDLDGLIFNESWSVGHDQTVFWQTEEHSVNPNANAVRWGTMYSFAFEAQNHFGPSKGETVGLGLFGPGEVLHGGIGVAAWSPAHCDYFCPADISSPTPGVPDGILDFFDVSFFLGLYGNQNPGADFNNDGSFDFFDISAFLQSFQTGCP